MAPGRTSLLLFDGGVRLRGHNLWLQIISELNKVQDEMLSCLLRLITKFALQAAIRDSKSVKILPEMVMSSDLTDQTLNSWTSGD